MTRLRMICVAEYDVHSDEDAEVLAELDQNNCEQDPDFVLETIKLAKAEDNNSCTIIVQPA